MDFETLPSGLQIAIGNGVFIAVGVFAFIILYRKYGAGFLATSAKTAMSGDLKRIADLEVLRGQDVRTIKELETKVRECEAQIEAHPALIQRALDQQQKEFDRQQQGLLEQIEKRTIQENQRNKNNELRIDTLEHELSTQQVARLNAETELSKTEKRYADTIDTLNTRIDDLERKVAEQTTAIANLQAENGNKDKLIEELQAEKKSLEDTKHTLEIKERAYLEMATALGMEVAKLKTSTSELKPIEDKP